MGLSSTGVWKSLWGVQHTGKTGVCAVDTAKGNLNVWHCDGALDLVEAEKAMLENLISKSEYTFCCTYTVE
jgi:hypothetical protein